jgi:hypothetical protein
MMNNYYIAIISNIAGFALILWGWAKIKNEKNAIIILETDIQNKQLNIAGIAGFVCALLAPLIFIILILVRVADVEIADSELYVFMAVAGLMFVEGLILSIVGVRKKSQGFAIAGLIISGIVVIAAIGIISWASSMANLGRSIGESPWLYMH